MTDISWGEAEPGGSRRSSWRAVAAVAAAALVASWLVWVIVSLVAHDAERDRFGTFDVPGEAVLRLEQGEVAVSYFERGTSVGDETLSVPADLSVEIRPVRGGAALPLGAIGLLGEQFEDSSGTGTRIARVDVPADGAYRVTARGAEGRRDPELMLGPATAFLATAPGIGLLAGAGVIVLAAMGWAAVFMRRARGAS